MKANFFFTLFGITFLLFGIPLAGLASTNGFHCSNGNAVITLSDPVDGMIICQAVADASAFLGAYGLEIGEAIEIQTVEGLPIDRAVGMLGYYDHNQEQIYILSFSSCIKNMVEMFGMPVDHDLYKSLIVHEVAHVIASKNFAVAQTFIAHEYIAYVTQLSTMPSVLREKILADLPGDGFTATEQINLTLFILSPELFAVQAYRHFQRPENGAAFLQRLLREEFSIDPYP